MLKDIEQCYTVAFELLECMKHYLFRFCCVHLHQIGIILYSFLTISLLPSGVAFLSKYIQRWKIVNENLSCFVVERHAGFRNMFYYGFIVLFCIIVCNLLADPNFIKKKVCITSIVHKLHCLIMSQNCHFLDKSH